MQALWQDLRFSVRSLRENALLSAVVIATLTLGVGFSAGIFTLINAIYLRAKVDKDHDSFVEVYSVYTQDPTRPGAPDRTTLEDYLAFRDRAKSLGKLALQFPNAPPTCPATSPDRERPGNLPESSYLAPQGVWGPACTRNKLPRTSRGLCQPLRVSKSH